MLQIAENKFEVVEELGLIPTVIQNKLTAAVVARVGMVPSIRACAICVAITVTITIVTITVTHITIAVFLIQLQQMTPSSLSFRAFSSFQLQRVYHIALGAVIGPGQVPWGRILRRLGHAVDEHEAQREQDGQHPHSWPVGCTRPPCNSHFLGKVRSRIISRQVGAGSSGTDGRPEANIFARN